MISVSHRVVVHETEPGVCLTTASGLSIETASREHPLIAGLLLAVAALVVGMPLFAGQVLGGHDIVVYLINAQQMAENQREGELFPAWAGGFNAGYGSPTLLFFPPLTSYLHATAIHLGIPVIAGVCIWSMVGLFFSGAAMFGWLRSIGSCPSALAGALVYMVAPYRVINLYHRSALAEHWAFVWPPLILWAATTSRMPPAVRVPLVAFSVVALLLSNIPLALLFGVGLATWFVLRPTSEVAGWRLRGGQRSVSSWRRLPWYHKPFRHRCWRWIISTAQARAGSDRQPIPCSVTASIPGTSTLRSPRSWWRLS